MDAETEPAQDILYRELKTLASMAARPVVQRQLLALGLVLVAAWALSKLTEYLLKKRVARNGHDQDSGHRVSWWRRLLPSLGELLFPVYALIFLQIAVAVLKGADDTTGLLLSGTALLWLLFVYRLVGALLLLRFDVERTRYYQRRIVFPLALWVLIVLLAKGLNLQSLGDIELFQVSDTPVTLGRLFTSVYVFYFFLVGSSLLQDILRSAVLPRTDADLGVINSVLAVTRYAVIILAVIVSLGILGFSLTTLAVIGGGLSIGVGIGLQSVVSNFIAGILLLFEQALRPGDVIEVDGEIGTVEKLSIRSTLLRTNDNVELIIPNDTFLTSAVKTFTKSNRHVRIAIDVGVAYGSDVAEVRDILLGIAHASAKVRDEPASIVFFRNFGDSSLDFQLSVWVDEPIEKQPIASSLRFAIWQAFTERGIEIPFPQRDLNLGAGWERLAPGLSPSKTPSLPQDSS